MIFRVSKPIRWIPVLAAFALSATVGACENTWHGMKQDTGENMEKTGESLEKAGEKTKPDKSY